MQGSKYRYLQDINKIVLCAGHGGDNSPGNNYDPGSVNGKRREADENIYLTDKIAQLLREMGLSVDVAPHNLNLRPTIDYLNRTYPNWTSNDPNKAWVIEVHRDWNNPNMEEARKNDQVGIYYWGDPNGDGNNSDDDPLSREIADGLLENFLKQGAHQGSADRRDFNGSWSKDNFVDGAGFHLGFIKFTNQIAHLLELGFMSGRGDQTHLDKLATWSARSIYSVFTGRDLVAGNNPKPVSKPQQQQSETIPRKFALNALYGNDKEKDTRFVGRDADIHQKISNNDIRGILNDLVSARNLIDNYKKSSITREEYNKKLAVIEEQVDELEKEANEYKQYKDLYLSMQQNPNTQVQTGNEAVIPPNNSVPQNAQTHIMSGGFIANITEKFSLNKVGIGLFRFGVGYSFLIVIAWVCLLVIVELGLNDVDPQLVIQIQDFLLTTGRPAVVTTPALMTAYSIFKQVIPKSPVIEQLEATK